MRKALTLARAQLAALKVREPLYRVVQKLGAARLAQDLYRGLLGRAADAGGLATYGGTIAAGELLQAVVEIGSSREAWERQLGERAEELVRLLFLALLQREPEPAALAVYVAQLREHKDLRHLIGSIAGSAEHFGLQLAAAGEQWVRQLYLTLLQREPEPAALAAYAAQLREHRDLIRLITALAQSDEHWRKLLALHSEELVGSLYQGVLQRPADEHGTATYAAQLREGKDLTPLLRNLSQSQEHWEQLLSDRAEALVGAVFEGLGLEKPDERKLSTYAAGLRRERNLARLVAAVTVGEMELAAQANKHRWPHPSTVRDASALVFLHMQKTAGTSLQNMLAESFLREGVYREHEDTLHLRSPAELASYAVFAGHFNYDSLAYIPRKRLQLVTFVREPTQRLISLYRFWRMHEPSHPNFSGSVALANQLPLAQFLQSTNQDVGIWNHMTWAIMGEREWRAWRRLLQRLNAEAAVQYIDSTIAPAIQARLREFLFVGLQEDFTRGVSLLFRRLKRPLPVIRNDHTLEKMLGGSADFKKELPAESLLEGAEAVLKPLVMLDEIVYREAQALYAQYRDDASEPEVAAKAASAPRQQRAHS